MEMVTSTELEVSIFELEYRDIFFPVIPSCIINHLFCCHYGLGSIFSCCDINHSILHVITCLVVPTLHGHLI
jgi:hypothetical protein